MPGNNDRQTPYVRKLPIVIGAVAAVFFYIMSGIRGGSSALASLSELALTITLFLFIISSMDFLLTAKISDEENDEEPATEDEPPETAAPSDGLTEIEKTVAPADTGTDRKSIFFTITYIVLLLVSAIWRIAEILTPPEPEVFNIVSNFFALIYFRATGDSGLLTAAYVSYGIADAVLVLAFPAFAVIYLKMRKDEGASPGDVTSHDMLTLFFYIALIYSAVFAVYAVLDVDFLFVLHWVYVAATVYLVVALAANILISAMRKKIFDDFNYALFPKFSDKDNVLDSDDVKQNFSLKSLYTIKYTLKILPGLVLALGLVLFLSTTVFVVQPYQQAAVFRFGRLNDIVGEGIHFKLPWPVDQAFAYDVHRVSGIQIGFESRDAFDNLWTVAHDGDELLFVLGGGNELVAANITVVYKISDLQAFITNARDPEAVLSAAAYESLLRRTNNTSLDAFLRVDRSSLAFSIASELSDFSESEGLGLEVVQVIIEGIHPPVEVAEVYQRVVTASLEKNTIITDAEARAVTLLIDAHRRSETAVNNALARQYEGTSNARRAMTVFYAAMEAYRVNPESFRLTRELDTFASVIEGGIIYVFSPGMEENISDTVIGNAPPLWER